MPDARLVSLYGHRLAPAGGTGIARYVAELTARLPSMAQDDLRYELGHSREPDVEIDGNGTAVRQPSWHRIPLHASWSLAKRPLVDRWLGWPDLIHVLWPSTPVPSRARAVYTVHDLMPWLNPTWHAWAERQMFARAVHHAADVATLVIADSEKSANEVVEHLGVERERIRVVHLGISPEFREPLDRVALETACRRLGLEPGRYAMMLGTVSVRKNPLTVLRALAASQTFSDGGYKLLLAGPPGVGFDDLQTEIAALGLDDRTVVSGWLPFGDVVALVGGAAVLTHPSVDEGFGMPPLEAMAAGVPVVASSAGSLPEVCGDAALLLAPGDVDAWAAAIDQVLTDEDLRASLVARGNEQHQPFTWDRCAEQTRAVHREALDR